MAALTRNGLGIMLVASLAVNVFVLGAFASHWFAFKLRPEPSVNTAMTVQQDDERYHSGVVGLPSPRTLLKVLTKKERDELLTAWRKENPHIRDEFKAMYDARDQVAAVLSAPEYSRDALAEAFADLRAHQMDLASTSQNLIIGLADKLDEDGRHRLAGIMKAPPGRPYQTLRNPDDKP